MPCGIRCSASYRGRLVSPHRPKTTSTPCAFSISTTASAPVIAEFATPCSTGLFMAGYLSAAGSALAEGGLGRGARGAREAEGEALAAGAGPGRRATEGAHDVDRAELLVAHAEAGLERVEVDRLDVRNDALEALAQV